MKILIYVLKITSLTFITLGLILIESLLVYAAIAYSSFDMLIILILVFILFVFGLTIMDGEISNRYFTWRYDYKKTDWVRRWRVQIKNAGIPANWQLLRDMAYFFKTKGKTKPDLQYIWVDWLIYYGKRSKPGKNVERIHYSDINKINAPSWAKYGLNGVDIKEALRESNSY